MTLIPSTFDLPANVSPSAFESALESAAAKWSYPRVSCTSLRVGVGAAVRQRLAEQDGQNLVVFRASRWCHNERCGKDATFPIAAAAMTNVYPVGAGPGKVVEADTELNAAHFDWLLAPDATRGHGSHSYKTVLEAVLLHELGHVLGFPDACKPEHCSESESRSVMNPSETLELSPEDVAAVCRAFPR